MQASPQRALAPEPFNTSGQHSLVAMWGGRSGYLQVASAYSCTHYADLPAEVLLAARHWAATLQHLGAKRVYWVTLSEQVTHLHIHLYPRWCDDEPERGTALFDQRHHELAQPQAWPAPVLNALGAWARQWDATLVALPNQPLAAAAVLT
jgi:hypothetical protein